MTEKEKAKAYDEALEKASAAHKDEDRHLKAILERIFPELKESEDEKIRKEIISILRNAYWTSNKNRFNELVAWLEKQRDKDKLIQELGEYKVKYTQEVLEKYINSMSNKDDERLRKTTIAFLKDFAKQGYENAVECIDWLEKQGEYLENYDEAEKEKADFVGDGFIECHADFLDFKEGNTYWLEYIGDDKYNVRSDNLLCKTYHITPCQLYTVFKKLTWIEKQGKQETLCDKCRKDHPSHSCQDITELGRCAVEHEHKPADKVEPKFHEGDWIIHQGTENIYQVVSIIDNKYQLKYSDNYTVQKCADVDRCARFWDITKDAKDGDVLEFGDHGRLVVGIVSYINKSTGKVDVYCLLENNKFKVGNYYSLDTINPHPASIEKRDTLMRAMADAGYEWDSEKKELKYKLTAFEDAIKDMMDNYRDAIDEDEATAEEVKNVLTIFNTL